jgi:hypothetical protein
VALLNLEVTVLPKPRPTAAALLLILALGCQAPHEKPETPLSSLASAASSPSFGAPFWAEQAHRHTSAWRQALAYCAGRNGARFPNCNTVHLVARWEDPPPPPPLPAFRLPEGLARELDASRPKGER